MMVEEAVAPRGAAVQFLDNLRGLDGSLPEMERAWAMDRELKALIDSPEFGRYHKELQAPAFNPFDVLQVADFEIRHSNVLAWLLQPGGTHGIGGRFLRALVEHLTLRGDTRSLSRLKPLPPGFDDESNIDVRREDYHERLYADITVGFQAERVLLIIENKVEASSRDAEKQVEDYQRAFRKKYKNRYDDYPGALLTVSPAPETGDAKGDVIHVSWKDVSGIIGSLLDDQETFTDGHVRAFVERYLDVIEEKLVWAGNSLADRLLQEHERALRRLQDQPSLLKEVEHAPHRKTVERLRDHFPERSARLRERVEDYLKLERRSTAGTRKTGPGCWLHWYDMPFGKELNVSESVWWCFTFESRHVSLELADWGRNREEKSSMERLWSFLQETPIDPDRSSRYPMEEHVIYRHSLLKDDELSKTFEEVVKLLRHRMDEFFGGGGDHQRIKRYFKCLAFDSREPRRPEEGETAG